MASQSNLGNPYSFFTDHYTLNKDEINYLPIIQLHKLLPTGKDNKALAETNDQIKAYLLYYKCDLDLEGAKSKNTF